ncbi:molybdopterin molybdotransferase MoeA [Blautia schinkii]|nr:molybdopterin molybdotransferase MoeA [Blautia schinkii]
MKNLLEGITLEEARSILLSLPLERKTEYIPLEDSIGRVLTEDYHAPYMLPSFSKSPLDGYAFRSADTTEAKESAPVTLRIIEEIPAGEAPTKAIGPGEAAKILTGAPIPKGADAVVRYEDTRFTGETVTIFQSFKPDTNIIHAGEDVNAGALVANAGTVVTPALAGLFASLGIPRLHVYAVPKAALISTGNELVEVSKALSPGKIHNSSLYTLGGYIKQAGASLVFTGLARDCDEAIAAAIKTAASKADVVITTGGVSVGDYDRVRAALESLGAEILFWRLAIKPGAALIAALFDGRLILGLSGNPGSAATALNLLALPYIKKLRGMKDVLPPRTQACIKESFPKSSPCARYLRGSIVYENGTVLFTQTGSQGNNIISSFVNCSALAEIPAGSSPVPAGTMLDVYLLDL